MGKIQVLWGWAGGWSSQPLSMIAGMKTLFVAFVLGALLLAACGGGNSSDGSAGTIAPVSQSSVVPTSSVAPTALPTTSESTEPPSESSVPTSSTSSETSLPASGSSDPTDGSASNSTSESGTPTADLTALYKDEIDEMIRVTERIRGLKFLTPPKVILLDQESFTERMSSGSDEEFFEDIDAEEAMYKLLGLIKLDASLRQIYTGTSGSGVRGFYDSEEKELVVPIRGTGIGIDERLTLVHELTHVLTDQHFNFAEKSNELVRNNDTEGIFALSAMIEGDAIEVQKRYFDEEVTDEELAQLNEPQPVPSNPPDAPNTEAPSGNSDSGNPSGNFRIPQFLGDQFSFPYGYGSNFLRSLVGRDATDLDPLNDEDFQKINQAYLNPPVSTEQIYFSKKYPLDTPLDVDHRIADLPDYELVKTNTWGASSLATMFDQVLNYRFPDSSIPAEELTPTAILLLSPNRPAVKGWGGDRYSLWFNGSDVAFVMTYRGDEASDAEELSEALQKYISTGMNVGEAEVSGDTVTWSSTEDGEDFAWLSVEGDTLRFVATSDPAVGAKLVTFYEAA